MVSTPAAPARLTRHQAELTMGGLMLALFLASLDQTVMCALRCAATRQERQACGDEFGGRGSNGC